jgi:hypothetical protein
MPILPVKQQIITPFAHHTAILSILANDDKHLPWIYTNYIQLVSFGSQTALVDFYSSCYSVISCPFIVTNSISRTTIKEENRDIVQLFKDLIDNGNYIYAGVDGYHIPAYAAYQQSRFQHPIFIHGYDAQREIFYVGDFFRHGMFKFVEITFQELVDGYNGLSLEDDFGAVINYFSYREGYTYDFDLKKLKDILTDFFTSQISASYELTFDLSRINAGNNATKPPLVHAQKHWVQFDTNREFGINVYDVLLNNLKLYVSEGIQFDSRAFFILVQQKMILLELMKYLQDHHFLKSDYYYTEMKKLTDATRIVQNLIIKFRMTNKIYLMDQIIETTQNIYETEKVLIESLIEDLHP